MTTRSAGRVSPLSAISPQEEWPARRIRYWGRFVGGGTPSKENVEFWAGSIPWVSPKDFLTERISTSQDRITEQGLRQSATRLVPARSLLLVTRSGILRRTIPVAVSEVPVALNQDVKAVIFDGDGDPRFLLYWVRGMERSLLLAWRRSGATVESLESDLIRGTPVPCPPTNVQQKIADFLDRETAHIDRLIERKERLIALLEEKRSALITQAVTKGLDPGVPMKDSGVEWIGEIPEHWHAVVVRRVAQLRTGHTPSRTVPEYWQDCTIPWVTLADVWSFRDDGKRVLTDTKEKVSELGLRNSSAVRLPPGTVLLSRTASVGFSVIAGIELATTQDFVNWTPGPSVLSEYLLYTFRAMRPEFRRLTMGSTHQTIYMPDVQGLTGPLPPLREQKRIAEHLDEASSRLFGIVERTRESVALLRERRSALITAAVTGLTDVEDYEASRRAPLALGDEDLDADEFSTSALAADP